MSSYITHIYFRALLCFQFGNTGNIAYNIIVPVSRERHSTYISLRGVDVCRDVRISRSSSSSPFPPLSALPPPPRETDVRPPTGLTPLDRSGRFQHTVEHILGVQAVDAAKLRWAVVASTDEHAVDPVEKRNA
jgi:hypothetical protein